MFKIKNKFIIVLVFLILALGLIFVWKNSSRIIKIENQSAELVGLLSSDEISPLSGLACFDYQRRPLAVVLANDPVDRPLFGLSDADLVFEMPVITNSITRIIAVYVCNFPEKIGSLRSARHDFIPLIMGLDGILVHWGGSHFALDKLNAGIMDNIDALKNPYNAFYQISWIPQPHNGFTSMDSLINSAEKLDYRMENEFEGYSHIQDKSRQFENKILRIGYSYPYNVSYQYDSNTNSYLRYRANLKEIDKNNNEQISAKNIVIMRAFSRQIQGPDYNDLDIEGTGECEVYQNGIIIPCTWQKDKNNQSSKLYFLDENNKEVPFVPGQIWIEIVEPNQEVSWE